MNIITKLEWEKRLKDVKVSKEDMNRLVMNFLVTEGYGKAAQAFQIESGAELEIDLATLDLICLAKDEVVAGNTMAAIATFKSIHREVMEINPQLMFHLHQQCFIELIQKKEYTEALEFSSTKLAPVAEKNPELLEELERVLAVFAFEDEANCPVSDLFGKARCQEIASKAIVATLTGKGYEIERKLPKILKMLAWVQDELGKALIYPRLPMKR